MDWPTEIMFPIAKWLFRKPNRFRRKVYRTAVLVMIAPGLYWEWERKIVGYRSPIS